MFSMALQMIEREVLDRNPNVRWSDIAELKEVQTCFEAPTLFGSPSPFPESMRASLLCRFVPPG